jgi:tetratricopeptide (TPR) repeat protein
MKHYIDTRKNNPDIIKKNNINNNYINNFENNNNNNDNNNNVDTINQYGIFNHEEDIDDNNYTNNNENNSNHKNKNNTNKKSIYSTKNNYNTNKNNFSAAMQFEDLNEFSVYQETLYNLGRAFQDIDLNHLAVEQYKKALDLVEKNEVFSQCVLNVTKEAAFNLVLLYKKSNANNLAFQIMQKYLSFD